MRAAQLETWVLDVVDQVSARNRVEDSRIELKSQWPDHYDAARRIAAHANAARGESVLWIIGLNEERGVISCASPEFSTWWAQVRKWFDGVAPDVTDLVVSTGDGSVTALLFATQRAPFVVRNSVYGKPEGGSVQLEVPWRDATGVRTAKREDLLRLLVPLQRLPHLEPMSAILKLFPPTSGGAEFRWTVEMKLYVTPCSDSRLILPRHHTSVSARVAGVGVLDFARLEFESPSDETVTITGAETILKGPGRLVISGSCTAPMDGVPQGIQADVNVRIVPAGPEARESVLSLELAQSGARAGDTSTALALWRHQKAAIVASDLRAESRAYVTASL